jgi:phosphatidylglycerol:prolipoprotein diacylglycerol transferase
MFARRVGISSLGLVDTAAFMTPPGLMFGRLANWVNGELWGKVLPGAMQAAPPWWSVKYPDEALVLAPTPDAYVAAKHLHAMVYAGNTQAIQDIAALVPARYPNNFIQALTDGPLLMLALIIVWWKPRHAGALTGTFLIAYGILRNVSEQFREPDDGVFTVGSVTVPMMVSAIMVLLGVAVIIYSTRTKGSLIGGVAPRVLVG